MPSAASAVSSAPGRRARWRGVAVLVALILALPLAALAADASAANPAAPATLGATMQAVVDAGMAQIATLETQAKAALDEKQALEAQASIIQAKADMQRRLFVVQLDFARRENRAALVTELEGILSRLDQPATGVAQDHPVPSTMPSGR